MTGIAFLLSKDILFVIVYKSLVPNTDNSVFCDKRRLIHASRKLYVKLKSLLKGEMSSPIRN